MKWESAWAKAGRLLVIKLQTQMISWENIIFNTAYLLCYSSSDEQMSPSLTSHSFFLMSLPIFSLPVIFWWNLFIV